LFLFKIQLGGAGGYGADMARVWTITLTSLAVFQWFNVWNCRHDRQSVFSANLFSNKYLNGAFVLIVGLHLFAVYNPFMQKILNTTGLYLNDWIYIIALALSVIVFEEIRKLIARKI
jgi:P-type Ca2+ transporter type 2C